MAQEQPGHPHGVQARNVWDSLTSAVGQAFNGQKGKTVVQTVYTTQAPSGYTGALTTKTAATGDSTKTTTTADKKSTTTTKATTTTPTKTTSATTTSQSKTTSTTAKATTTAKTTSETLDSATSSSTKTTETTTSEAAALTLDTTTTHSSTSATLTASSTSAAATASSTSTSTGGTTTAAKAGIAIGVLGGLFVIFLLVFLVFRKHKRQGQRQPLDDDEKVDGPFGDHAAIGGGGVITSVGVGSAATFLPSLGNSTTASAGGARQQQQQQDNYPDRRASRGSAIALQNQAPMASRPGTSSSAWERPKTGTSTTNNPFGDSAELESPDTANPFHSVSGMAAGAAGVAGAAAAGAAGAAGAAVGSLVRKASTRKDGPKALDLTLTPPTFGANLGTVPASPAGTEFSFTSETTDHPQGPSASGAAIAAAGGPATSTVHRVQLDFLPTLEDELELHAGQLVRMLHEYDDGWALCIRLDRSRQGVVPRTCLSARPVKPRPPPGGGRPGPPINTGGQPRPNGPMRPMGPMSPMGPMGPMGPPGANRPQQQAGRPLMPPGGPKMMSRPQSPYGGPQNRPASAAGGHPMSPAFSASSRSQSPALRSQPSSPAGNRPPYPTSSQPQSPIETTSQQARSSGSSPLGRTSGSRNGPIGRKPVPGQAY